MQCSEGKNIARMKKCSTAEEKNAQNKAQWMKEHCKDRRTQHSGNKEHRESEDTRHSEDGRTEGKQIWKITRMAVTAMAEK